jgi:hypothetical protein
MISNRGIAPESTGALTRTEKLPFGDCPFASSKVSDAETDEISAMVASVRTVRIVQFGLMSILSKAGWKSEFKQSRYPSFNALACSAASSLRFNLRGIEERHSAFQPNPLPRRDSSGNL